MTPSPRITLLLFAFNQVALVGDAVRACLAQEGEPLEIVLSDDASTDGTFVELQRLAAAYGGPHHVRVRRNAVNLGVGAHYNAAVADCGGQLIVTAAGDDISLPHRVRTLAAAWDATGQEVDLLASHLIDTDAQGNDVGVLRVDNLAVWRSPGQWVHKRPYVVGASHAFTRRLFDRFGPIRADLPYEDQVMALRASCMGGGITLDEPLVRYRRGGLSAASAKRLDAAGYRRALAVKHTRQRALALQISHDLTVAGRADLWGGRMLRKLHQSELMLALLAAGSWGERQALVRKADQAGVPWALLQAVNVQWPAFGTWFRNRALQR